MIRGRMPRQQTYSDAIGMNIHVCMYACVRMSVCIYIHVCIDIRMYRYTCIFAIAAPSTVRLLLRCELMVADASLTSACKLEKSRAAV